MSEQHRWTSVRPLCPWFLWLPQLDTIGLFLGKCVPCSCNGHSDQCLDGSGICVVRSSDCTLPPDVLSASCKARAARRAGSAVSPVVHSRVIGKT
uniref:Secreted protein n=1 Tax=Haplochromis burtoni TaxID=8153 RepID=A0A3Q2WRN7_HAPBU